MSIARVIVVLTSVHWSLSSIQSLFPIYSYFLHKVMTNRGVVSVGTLSASFTGKGMNYIVFYNIIVMCSSMYEAVEKLCSLMYS